MTHATHTPANISRDPNAPADSGPAAAVNNDELLGVMAKLRARLATIQQEAAQDEAGSQARAQWVVATRQTMTALDVGLKDAQALMDLQKALKAPGGRQAMALKGIVSVLKQAATELLPKVENQTLEQAIQYINDQLRQTVGQAINKDPNLLALDAPLMQEIVAWDQSTEQIDREASQKLVAAEQEMKAAELSFDDARKTAEQAVVDLEAFVKGLIAISAKSLTHQQALITALGDRLGAGAGAPETPLDPARAEASVVAYVALVMAVDGLGATKVEAEQRRLIQQAEQAEQQETHAFAVLQEKKLAHAEARRTLEKKREEKAAALVVRDAKVREIIQRVLQAPGPTPPPNEGNPTPTDGDHPEPNPG